MQKQILFFSTLLFLLGCSKQTCEIEPEVARIKVEVKLERLEKSFFAAKTEPQMLNFLKANPDFVSSYLGSGDYPDDADLTGSLLRLSNEPNLNKFARETQQQFGDMADVETGVENAFKHLEYFYPDFKVPPVKTFISGLLGPDLYVSDSLVVLGIDYFAGKKAAFRPQQPGYILQRYEKGNMLPALVMQISKKYIPTAQGNTMLAQMIDYGKTFYFTQRMLPCTPDSLIVGYTAQEMADVHYNEGKIWAHFVEKSLLYETSHFKVNKYTGERPNIPEIGIKCPGRVATWVGWQIVRKYMEENPEVTVQQLMQETDAQKIFLQSKYKPKKR